MVQDFLHAQKKTGSDFVGSVYVGGTPFFKALT